MKLVRQLWGHNPALTATTALMLADLVICVVGLALDPTIITGAPAWLKPAKFAISTAILTATLAWFYGYAASSRRLRWAALAASIALTVEIVIIDIQAARGAASHFNQSTPLNRILFIVMGIGIGVIWVSMVAMTVDFFSQRFENRSFGWAVRMGLLITTIGSATSGGMMIAPSAPQRAALANHERLTAMGGHTVGAPDGGPGLPGTDWSTEHGDLRIPHFLALHALQVIPFVAWFLMGRVRSQHRATQLVFTASASYLALTAILTWQALRGEPLIHPSQTTLTVAAVWVCATAGAAAVIQLSTTQRAAAAHGAHL